MKIKTSELTDAALDYAVFIAKGDSFWLRDKAAWDSNLGFTEVILDSDGVFKRFEFDGNASRAGHWRPYDEFKPSTNWKQGGPIIEQHCISLMMAEPGSAYAAEGVACVANKGRLYFTGPTTLIAAMRCYVASKLGDEVDVPEELL